MTKEVIAAASCMAIKKSKVGKNSGKHQDSKCDQAYFRLTPHFNFFFQNINFLKIPCNLRFFQ